MQVDTWNPDLAASTKHISVHLVSTAQSANSLMFYLETNEDIALTTIPQTCGCIEEALERARTVAAKHEIALILVDDNRTGSAQ